MSIVNVFSPRYGKVKAYGAFVSIVNVFSPRYGKVKGMGPLFM